MLRILIMCVLKNMFFKIMIYAFKKLHEKKKVNV